MGWRWARRWAAAPAAGPPRGPWPRGFRMETQALEVRRLWASARGPRRYLSEMAVMDGAVGVLPKTGNDMLRHIAEQSSRPFSKYSLNDLLHLQELSPEERLMHLDAVLHVGLSKIVLLLQDLPLGFGSGGPIRSVIQDYVRDLQDLQLCRQAGCPPKDPGRYRECIVEIFARHRGMLGQIARGLLEFQRELMAGFEPAAGLGLTSCVDISDSVPAVRRIDRTLDEFFTVRTTLRLLIAHCLQLTPEDGGDEVNFGFAMHELLVRIPDSLRAASLQKAQTRHVGAICLETRPSLILIEAYQHAHYMCKREFRRASQMMVNGLPAKEYLQDGYDLPALDTYFPYVDIHLYFIFFEVIKNALLTSIRKTPLGERPPPIHASLITGTSLLAENERTVKITDEGEGIRREDIRKVWSYFHSSVTEPVGPGDGLSPTGSASLDLASARGGHDGGQGSGRLQLPFAGRGLGLAVSRVLARYFGGEIDLHSIPRKGTDVYIYL